MTATLACWIWLLTWASIKSCWSPQLGTGKRRTVPSAQAAASRPCRPFEGSQHPEGHQASCLMNPHWWPMPSSRRGEEGQLSALSRAPRPHTCTRPGAEEASQRGGIESMLWWQLTASSWSSPSTTGNGHQASALTGPPVKKRGTLPSAVPVQDKWLQLNNQLNNEFFFMPLMSPESRWNTL